MSLKINLKTLNQLTIIYVAIPLLIFLISWLKPYIAVVSFILFLYAIYAGYFKNNKFELKNLINNKNFAYTLLLISFLWCYFAGIGGFWYQSPDHDCRNAIFRDLINYNWPVYYKSADAAMVYYIGYWLPSAVFAKIFLFISPMFAFFIGNIFLLFYSIIGIFLFILHILRAVKIKKCSKSYLIILMLILFSGMDIIGILYPHFSSYMWHIEWWSLQAQFSSFTTVLFWVFNQGLPSWLLTLMFYNNKNKVENFGVIALLCFFCSPLPFMGLAVFLTGYCLKLLFDAYKTKKIGKLVSNIFSIQNIISVFLITPIICLYFISNHSTSANGVISSITKDYGFFYVSVITYFFVLEAGLYLILISRQYKYELLYYIVFISLICCPFIKVGYAADFCMRASIPALLILFIMIIKFLFNNYNFRKYKIRYILLCTCLIIGSVTPIIEFTRGFYDVITNRSIFRAADSTKTFEDKIVYNEKDNTLSNSNFLTIKPETKPFFKYLAKNKKRS
ncbi:hypothetical protein [Candidatus Ruminimicrobium bovinum]|uniref:hypothetical protein n=1 Tax=Candidatus Ruminimicrobium bovinum TaxID=3242779 RepID=UPI0039B89085